MTISVKVTVEADNIWDQRAFDTAVIQGQDKITEETGKDFELTAATWTDENKPSIIIERTVRQGNTYISSATAVGRVYALLNYGTDPHEIPAKEGGFLQFQTQGFIPKTNPKTIMPSSGRRAMGGFVRARSVSHPGTEPRRWDIAIADKRQGDLLISGNKAVSIALTSQSKSE